jgi:AcrR family transcriptional regulator
MRRTGTGRQQGWAGTTLPERQADRRARLLDAGLELVGTGGAAALGVRAACRGAQLSERYFYESFADREELLVAVHDTVADGARERILTVISGLVDPTPEAAARAGLEAFTDYLEEDPRRGRVLLIESFADEALVRRGIDALPGFAAVVAAQIRALPGSTADDRDAELTAVALVGALTMLYLGWLRGTLDVDRERLIDHAVLLMVRAAGVASG